MWKSLKLMDLWPQIKLAHTSRWGSGAKPRSIFGILRIPVDAHPLHYNWRLIITENVQPCQLLMNGVVWNCEKCTQSADLWFFHFFMCKIVQMDEPIQKTWNFSSLSYAQFASQTSLFSTTPFIISWQFTICLHIQKSTTFFFTHRYNT
jgi:hypothetical protein